MSQVLFDKPEAHKPIKDLDFSLDGTLVASTSDDSYVHEQSLFPTLILLERSLCEVRVRGLGRGLVWVRVLLLFARR